MKTIDFPLSKITLAFVFGILFAHFSQLSFKLSCILLATCFGLFSILHLVLGKRAIPIQSFGFMAYITSFVVGIITFVFHNDYNQPDNYIHFCNAPEAVHEMEIRLDEKLKNSPYRHRYIASVKQLDQKRVSGKILLNIERDSTTLNFPIGTILQVSAKIIRHKPTRNPGQFDYGKYLALKSIPAQLYIAKSDVKLGNETDKTIGYYAASLRDKIFKNLKSHNFKKEELNIAMALILGQQQEISKEILQDYQFAGAVHILSVSGLHVGFILLFINFLLARIPKNRLGNSFRFICIITGLWLFAILAGLAPSVVRSATMFSFIAFGMCLKRDTNVFHNLLISMLCILIFEPSFLFDVGFQLSYVSLFFILWLQPLFFRLWTPKSKIGNYFWTLITVSFAAQMGAFPLSIYYFHQFPGLFFITNLIILPGLGIIMGLGVFVMLLAAFDYVPELPMLLLEKSITVLNTTINLIASFEQFIYHDIPLGLGSMLLLYGCIISLFLWVEKPGPLRIYFVFIGIILFQTNALLLKWRSDNQAEMVIFHMRNETLISEKPDSTTTFYTSEKALKQLPDNNLVKAYLLENRTSGIYAKLRNTFFFNGTKILLIDSLGIYPKDISPDVILLSHSPKINLERILNQSKPSIIIADGSNYKTYVSRWNKTCTKQKIPFHSTYEKGFYRLE